LRRLERAIAAAVLPRIGSGGSAGRPPALPAGVQADLLARVAVAALRTAVLWRTEQAGPGGDGGPGLDRLLLDVLGDLAELAAERDLSRARR